MNYGYVYKTENLMNGRIYIGQRKGEFCSWYLGSGKILKQAINKFGKQSFRVDVLIYAKTEKQLNDYEIITINHYRIKFPDLYNIAEGGNNNPHLYQTGKTRFKKGMIPWNKGLKIQLNTGRTHIKKGQIIGRVYVKGQISTFKGKKHSPEALAKMSKTWFKNK